MTYSNFRGVENIYIYRGAQKKNVRKAERKKYLRQKINEKCGFAISFCLRKEIVLKRTVLYRVLRS